MIADHARREYPLEACGALLGAEEGVGRRVTRVVPMTNAAPSRAESYEIDPREQIGIERAARADGLVVLGYYHSHPDREAFPSGRDRAEAAPVYSYLIQPVTRCGPASPGSFRFGEAGEVFEEAILES